MSQNTVKRFDGIYRSTVTFIVDTWRSNPFRIPILLFIALLTFTGSSIFLYQDPEPVEATVTASGNIYYGDTTNAGKLKMTPYTNPSTFGSELNINLGPTVNIMHTVAKTAWTREEKMIGFISGNPTNAGRLDIVTGTTGFESATDYTLRWTATAVSGTQDCDNAPTTGTCTQPFDIGYESLSGRGLVVYAGDADANSTTDTDKIYYAFWNGSGCPNRRASGGSSS